MKPVKGLQQTCIEHMRLFLSLAASALLIQSLGRTSWHDHCAGSRLSGHDDCNDTCQLVVAFGIFLVHLLILACSRRRGLRIAGFCHYEIASFKGKNNSTQFQTFRNSCNILQPYVLLAKNNKNTDSKRQGVQCTCV